MHYKDMTFCSSDCINTNCPRNMMLEEYDRAYKWWGSAPVPIAYVDFSGDCEDYLGPE